MPTGGHTLHTMYWISGLADDNYFISSHLANFNIAFGLFNADTMTFLASYKVDLGFSSVPNI